MARTYDYIPPKSVSGSAGGVRKPKNALEALTPAQRAQLTPQAKKILASTPVRINPSLNQNVGKGAVGEANRWNAPFGPINPSITLAPRALTSAIPFHEGLHVLDFMSGLPSSKLVNTPETRKALASAYYSNLPNPNFGTESHIPQREAFAQAAMYGYGNIPPEMRKYYTGLLSGAGVGRASTPLGISPEQFGGAGTSVTPNSNYRKQGKKQSQKK